jgi:hypothetical protein
MEWEVSLDGQGSYKRWLNPLSMTPLKMEDAFPNLSSFEDVFLHIFEV